MKMKKTFISVKCNENGTQMELLYIALNKYIKTNK